MSTDEELTDEAGAADGDSGDEGDEAEGGPPGADDVINQINDSARHLNGVTLTFLATCVYIGVAIASTTDELLLAGTSIVLPLLNVHMPLEWFFFFAPLLLWILHLNLLLQQYLLVRKADPERLRIAGAAEKFFPVLPLGVLWGRRYHWLVRILLGTLLAAVNVLPTLILLLAQIRFLPYHSAAATAWHEVLVLSDLALLWYFFVSTPRATGTRPGAFFRLAKGHGLSLAALGSLAIVLLSTMVAQGPGTGYELLTGEEFPFPMHRNLVLHEPSRRSAARGEGAAPAEGSVASSHSLDFHGRDLRGADFSHATLDFADFRGARLDGATLMEAHLHAAELTPVNEPDVIIDAPAGPQKRRDLRRISQQQRSEVASLRNARLSGADLSQAKLILADLRGADLSGAHLEGADLSFAQLRHASLAGAHLAGADLSNSVLDLADLRDADLRAANLAGASLVGADLRSAKLMAADLSTADLRGAHLVSSQAQAAVFSNAKLLAADFQQASLEGARELAFEYTRLRGAELSGVDNCWRGAKPIVGSDLRALQLHGPGMPSWAEAGKDPLADVAVPLPDPVRRRLEGERGTTCLAPEELERGCNETTRADAWRCPPAAIRSCEARAAICGRWLLYDSPDEAGAMRGWPLPELTESAYDERFAKMVIAEVCEAPFDDPFPDAVVAEIGGAYAPRESLLAKMLAQELLRRLTAPEPAAEQRGPGKVDSCLRMRGLSWRAKKAIKEVAGENVLRPRGTWSPADGLPVPGPS